MAKILISESDIESMVFEGVQRILEAVKHGTAKGSGIWEPENVFADSGLDNDEIDAMIRKYPGIEWNGYRITVSVSSTEYSGEDGPGNVADYGKDREYGGDYDKAVADISQLSNPVLRDKLTQNLNDFCASIEAEEFEESYPEDYLDLEESRDEPGGNEENYDRMMAFREYIEGMNFSTPDEFLSACDEYGLDLTIFKPYLTHRDIPTLDKGLYVIFFPRRVRFDDNANSFSVDPDDIDYEYAQGEKCSVNGQIVPLKKGLIPWLDQGVDACIEENFNTIIEGFYNTQNA